MYKTYKFAGFFSRAFSFIIELLVLLICALLIKDSILYYIITACYTIVLPVTNWQATIGMRLLSLVIADNMGNRLSIFKSLIRYLAFFVPYYSFLLGLAYMGFRESQPYFLKIKVPFLVIFSFLYFIFNIAFVISREDSRSITDLITGTCVLRRGMQP